MTAYEVTDGKGFRLADHDPRADSGIAGKQEGRAEVATLTARLEQLHDKLYADGRHKVLIVLQGMDTSGKGGAIRKAFEGFDPTGVHVAAFKAPTEVELAHDFLWRIHPHVPENGHISIFDRSHYEDVLIVRVHDLVPKARWKARYDHIRHWEQMLADEGTVIRKFFLHISKEEQAARLQARVDNPTKHWKFREGGPGRARLLGRLPAGLRGGDPAHRDAARPLDRGAGRPQVAPGLRDLPHDGRDPRGPRPALPRGRRGPVGRHGASSRHPALPGRPGASSPRRRASLTQRWAVVTGTSLAAASSATGRGDDVARAR